MSLAWIDEVLTKEPTNLQKRLNEAIDNYKIAFGNTDSLYTEPCDDYEELIKKIELSIKLKIKFDKLYPLDYNCFY